MGQMTSGSDIDTRFADEIGPGDRVRMSAQGLARHPKYGEREGIVVARGALPSSLRVKFDERKSIQALHRTYLEKVDPPALTAPSVKRQPNSSSRADVLPSFRSEGVDR
jgi:hypothetical protein